MRGMAQNNPSATRGSIGRPGMSLRSSQRGLGTSLQSNGWSSQDGGTAREDEREGNVNDDSAYENATF